MSLPFAIVAIILLNSSPDFRELFSWIIAGVYVFQHLPALWFKSQSEGAKRYES